jgi:cellulose synthase/poly-beta-1,6-N-acetylglucosamine synthase-like glycosyltransferase
MNVYILSFDFVIGCAYAAMIISFYLAWKKYPAFKTVKTQNNLFVSIIIPARNEESNISNILSDLSLQNFAPSNFEILIVNDHSEDATRSIAEKYFEKLNNLVIYDLPENLHGKKRAISFAVARLKGELIISLDADCRIGKSWLSTIVSFYNRYKPKLIIGPLLYTPGNSIFEKIQSLEVTGLVASGAGASVMGRAIMCNGANLAFPKDVYLELESNLKAGVASGDDLFLLLSVKQRWPKDIRFLKSKNALALTNPASDFMSFLQQRKRWTSKSRHYKDNDVIRVAAVVFGFNLAIVISFFTGLFLPWSFLFFITLLVLKSFADLLLLNSFAAFFDQKKFLKYFWIAQIIYPFYIVFMVVYGNIGTFKWKDRIYF